MQAVALGTRYYATPHGAYNLHADASQYLH